MNKLKFIKDMSTGIETVSFEEVNISYPVQHILDTLSLVLSQKEK